MAKELVVSSLLITTEEKILVQDIGHKRMKLPYVLKKGSQSIQDSAHAFAAQLNKELKVGGILFVVEETAEHKGWLFTTPVNETSFVFNVRNKEEFKVRRPYYWLPFEYLNQLDIADELKQLIVSNQVIKSSVPLINLNQ
ncbi:hypothetical protein [Macrococcus equipercicus]|uniref:Uncharacterized protein n=1 Tax=Macrococcus equipercicus TaxID=69967 RepID=A0A9Q9F0W5_9STAP|nr:hypothetical protein [Macrococcus equipercicus]KAA1040311.1 hypothetical protein ERX35_004785 [Macrococcus equipercicus]UTH12746.1 hypothetical protein KFV11_05510 [Macrococcus equipercicus]